MRRDELRALAKRFRTEATPAEQEAWEIVRAHRLFGLKFKRQFPYRGFILDLFCRELSLAVEIDGDVHLDPQQAAADAERQEVLEACGLRVIRVKNESVSRRHLEELIRPFLPLSSNEERG
jgi:very-short-patch-repair endonuclease